MADATTAPPVLTADTAASPVEPVLLPLPVPADPALLFYAIRLEDDEGFTPAALEAPRSSAYVDPRDPYDHAALELPGGVVLRIGQETELGKRSPKVLGHMVTRSWRALGIGYRRGSIFFEDPRVAAAAQSKPVVEVALWCPVLANDRAMRTLAEHGPYTSVSPIEVAGRKQDKARFTEIEGLGHRVNTRQCPDGSCGACWSEKSEERDENHATAIRWIARAKR